MSSHLSPYYQNGEESSSLLAPSPTPTHNGDNVHHNAAKNNVQSTDKQEPSSAFLKDLNLVAEAAKRAQNALLVRDFKNVSV